MAYPKTLSPTIEKNLSSEIDRSGVNLTLNDRKRYTNRTATKPPVPPCRWHLTYWIAGSIEHHYPIGTWPEEVVLSVGRGIPLKAEFDDHGNDRWTPIGRHLYHEFYCYPELVAQQNALREMPHAA